MNLPVTFRRQRFTLSVEGYPIANLNDLMLLMIHLLSLADENSNGLADDSWRGRFYRWWPVDAWFAERRRAELRAKYHCLVSNDYYLTKIDWTFNCREPRVMAVLQWYLDANTPVTFRGREVWVMLARSGAFLI